jgi:SpoVK/Ycf46/Vps4 family AAA+-type ATPase
MFKEDNVGGKKTKTKVNLRTAMFFGPPGTGKTTLARAFANKLDWKYLELTPGDFYSGGENEILPKINNIFFNLMHLKETVVFIDEIDDLVIKRKQDGGFDRRTLYVNTLLPRFQEIHDKSEIILLASTNHYNNVDPAISRLGRFDLVIPVGPMSEHGRIDLFFNKIICSDEDNFVKKYNCHEILKDLLKNTSGYTFTQVKLFVDEFKKAINSKTESGGIIINTDFLVKFSASLKLNNFNPEIKSGDTQTLRFGSSLESENIETDRIRPFSKFDYTDSTLDKADKLLRTYNVYNQNNESVKIKIDQIIDLYSLINIANELITVSTACAPPDQSCATGSNFNKTIGFLTLSKEEKEMLNVSQNHLDNTVDRINHYLDLFTQKPIDATEGDYYFNLATPFFDSIDFLYKNSTNEIQDKLQNKYRKLDNLIRSRKVI